MRGVRRVIRAIVLVLAVMGLPACGVAPEAEGPSLQVLSPQNFATVQLGESLEVISTATDPRGVTRIDLYVGEDLYRTDGSPTPEGETAWTLTQIWTPTAPGSYTLTVVAHNVDGVESTPWAVAVEVVEGPASGGTPASTVFSATGTPAAGATSTTAPPPSAATEGPPPPATNTAPPPAAATSTPPPPPPTSTPLPPAPTNTPPAMADLIITTLTVDPAQPRVGQEVRVFIRVRNQGNAPSGPYGYGMSVTPTPASLPPFAGQAGSLAPGEEREHALPAFTFAETGPATIRAGVGTGPGEDANEGNNSREIVVNVQPGDLPDLYIGQVSLNPASPLVGQEVQVSVSLSNLGTGDAGPFTMTWKSAPGTVSCSWDVDGLAAGRTAGRTCAFTYTSPNSGQSTYTTADANGDVVESNEDNNVRYLRVNVRPAP
jgi:hypothetical protein